MKFKTDANNAQSRAAIANLGTVEECIRGQRTAVPGGHIQYSAVSSIIHAEWPRIKIALKTKLVRPHAGLNRSQDTHTSLSLRNSFLKKIRLKPAHLGVYSTKAPTAADHLPAAK